MSACLEPSAIFCKLKNEGSLGATLLGQILFQIWKIFYGDFSDVATGLRRGLFEPYAVSRMVPAFQVGAEPPSKTTPNLDGLPRQWTTITYK